MASVDLPDLEYETLCLMCFGNGSVLKTGALESCETCDGIGYLNTREGDKLLEFLRRRKLTLRNL